jgi:hypothetical protein
MSVVVALGGLLFALLAILFYISVLITLPFSYTLLPAVAALIVGLTAFVTPPGEPRPDWRLAGVPLGLLLIPLAVFLTRPTLPLETGPIDLPVLRLQHPSGDRTTAGSIPGDRRRDQLQQPDVVAAGNQPGLADRGRAGSGRVALAPPADALRLCARP